MKIVFDESFYKRLVKIKEKPILDKVQQVIMQVEMLPAFQLANIKKLTGLKLSIASGLEITV